MTATKAGRRVVPIPLSQQPLIEGAGGGTMRATHWVHRGLPAAISALLPAGAPNELRFLHGPAFRFDACATKELAAVGVSTVVCADSGGVFVFPKGADCRHTEGRVACDTVEGRSIVPGDWCHATPTVALPHLRRRASTRGERHRPGRTSNVADTAIAARAGSDPCNRRRATNDVGNAGGAHDHGDTTRAPVAGPTTTGRAPSRPDGDTESAPDHAPDHPGGDARITDPEPDRAADAPEPDHHTDDGDGGNDGASLAPHHGERTHPGAGRTTRAGRAQLAATRQQRRFIDAARGSQPACPESVFQALAHPYAMHWLHAAVRERRGHLAPVNRPPHIPFHSATPPRPPPHVQMGLHDQEARRRQHRQV